MMAQGNYPPSVASTKDKASLYAAQHVGARFMPIPLGSAKKYFNGWRAWALKASQSRHSCFIYGNSCKTVESLTSCDVECGGSLRID